MDGGPMLVNDFLSHSQLIPVGEGPESIEPMNGTNALRTDIVRAIHLSRTALHGSEEWLDRRTGSSDKKDSYHLLIVEYR